MGRVWATVLLTLMVGACGSNTLTVAEYAAEAERLVAALESQFAALDGDWESRPPTLERARDYWSGRLAIRAEFLDGVQALHPPDDLDGMHATAIELFEQMAGADEALAASVDRYDSVTSHWQWIDTPEGQAADAALARVFAFCRSSQADFDATQERESLGEVSWIPNEATEIVRVAFGCPPAD